MVNPLPIDEPQVAQEHSATVAVALTARASGAVGVIAIAGPRIGEALRNICHRDLAKITGMTPGRIARTDFYHNEQVFDNGLIVFHSPTHIEFHLHGGTAVAARAMVALQEIGIRTVSAADTMDGDYLKSIPIHPQPRMPQSQLVQEIWLELCNAKSDAAVDQLAGQLIGGLPNWADQWRRRLLANTVEGRQLHQINVEAQWIRDQTAWSQYLLRPPVLAIIGAPNAGKSTLLNALTGRPASIVSNIPGTTRDWVDEPAFLFSGAGRILVRLVDTAGIRPTEDALESISIERTAEQLAGADILLFLADQSCLLEPQTAAILNRLADKPDRSQPLILVATKADLAAQWNPLVEFPHLPAVRLCAPELAGVAELSDIIFKALGLAKLSAAADVAFPCTSRQNILLEHLALAPTLIDAQRTIEALKG